MSSSVHPEHDHLVHFVQNLFHSPYHDMGYHAEKRRWGTYWNIGQVYTQGIPAEQVKAFLAGDYFRECRSVMLNVWTDNVDAIRLYHGLGFRDEITWRRRYFLRVERKD